jgi:hypothetical protein
MALYRDVALEAASLTVVDCSAPRGCRVDVAGRVDAVLIPYAGGCTERLVAATRDARTAATSGHGVAPRVLVIGSAGCGATRWVTSALATSAAAFPRFDACAAQAACAVLDLSLAPSPQAAFATPACAPGGAAALRFYARGDVVDTTHFFVGGTVGGAGGASAATADAAEAAAAASSSGSAVVEALVEVASSAHEAMAAVAAASLDFSTGGFVVDCGDSVAADPRAAEALIAKLVRQLRVSHIGVLVNFAHAGAKALLEAAAAASHATVRGVVVVPVRLPWGNALPGAVGDGASVGNDFAFLRSRNGDAIARAVWQYFTEAGAGASASRLVLQASAVDFVSAETLEPLTLSDVPRFALCGVAAPAPTALAGTAGDGSDGSGGAAARARPPGTRRVVVGFVVVVELGRSTCVVVAPSAGDLPSRTLLVARWLRVPPACVPSILETR